MKKTKNYIKVITCVIVFLLITIITIILDYNNALYSVSKNFNYDFLGIFIPNIVLIFIFFITYSLIEKRSIEKEERLNRNQLDILNIMLQKTYTDCKKVIDKFINDSYTLKEFIVPRNSSKKSSTPNIVNNFQELPFGYDEQIMKMMYDGLIDKEIINKYLEIKDVYKSYVKSKIDFYDLLQYDAKELNSLKESIKEDNARLSNLINEELARIEKSMKE